MAVKKMDADALGKKLNIDWKKIPKSEFKAGLKVELEHGTISKKTDVTKDNPLKTAKIALAHLKEDPKYYTRLAKMEKAGKKANKKGK